MKRFIIVTFLSVLWACGGTSTGNNNSQDVKNDLQDQEITQLDADSTQVDLASDLSELQDNNTGKDNVGSEDAQDTAFNDLQDASDAEEDTWLRQHQWTQIGKGEIPNYYDFRGITGVNGALYMVGSGPVAYMFKNGQLKDLSKTEFPLPKGLYAIADYPSKKAAYVVGMHGFFALLNEQGWHASGGCMTDSDCDKGNECVSGKCVNGVCHYTPTGKPGCCSTTLFECDFESSNCGFQFKDLYHDPSGGILWHRVCDLRLKNASTTGHNSQCALYFGDDKKACKDDPGFVCPDFDNGEVVGSDARTPVFHVPDFLGKATLSFYANFMLMDEEPYDDFSVYVDENGNKTKVWSRKSTTNSHGYMLVNVDLTPYAGKDISLIFEFNSLDSTNNNTIGVFVDDIKVSTTCPQSSSQGGFIHLPDIPLFAVCTNNDTVYTGGAGGYIARIKDNTVKQLNSDEVHDFVGAIKQDNRILAIGFGGKLLSVGDKDYKFFNTDNSNILALSNNLVAAGKSGTLFRIQGDDNIRSILVPITGDFTDVASCGPGLDVVAGLKGEVLFVKGNRAEDNYIKPDFKTSAVTCNGPNDIWVAGGTGIVYHYDGKNWEKLPDSPLGAAVLDIAADKNGDLLMVGKNGTAAYYSKGSWVACPVNQPVVSVDFIESGRAVAVGMGGVVEIYRDGKWTQVPPVFAKDYYDVRCQDKTCLIAGHGVVVEFSKGKLTSRYVDVEGIVKACFSREDRTVFVTTRSEAVSLKGDIPYLEPIEPDPAKNGFSPVKVGFYGVILTEKGDYLVGEEGRIFKWNKELWEARGAGPYKGTFRGVCVKPDGQVFAAGTNGMVLHIDKDGKAYAEPVSGAATLTGIWCDKSTIAVVGESGEFYLY